MAHSEIHHIAVGTGACMRFFPGHQSDETRRPVGVLNPMRDNITKAGTGGGRDEQLRLLSAQKATG